MIAQRFFHLFYSVLFLGLLLAMSLPSLRSLVTFTLPPRVRIMNGTATHVFENYYDSFFPSRRLGTNIWAAISYIFFHEGRPGVVIGDRGWLYTDEEFKTYPEVEKQITANLDAIRRVAVFLASRDIQLVVAVVPAKARVYPENRGRHRPAMIQGQLYGRLHGMLQQAGIPDPDLYTSLVDARTGGQVFFRTDTHWTPYGAQFAAHTIARTILRNHLLKPGDQSYVTELLPAETHAGDLLSYLPLDPWFAFLLPPADTIIAHKTYLRTEDSDDLLLSRDDRTEVALVGTSYSADPRWNFAGALRQVLGRDLVNYAEKGQGPVAPMLRFLQSEDFAVAPPALVLWEFPERYLAMPGTKEIRHEKEKPEKKRILLESGGNYERSGRIAVGYIADSLRLYRRPRW